MIDVGDERVDVYVQRKPDLSASVPSAIVVHGWVEGLREFLQM
jgi:hypothetical protein